MNNKDQTPYGIDKLSNIKPGTKIAFIKYWIAGVTYLLSFMTPAFLSTDGSTELLAFYLIFVLLIEYIANKMIIWMNNDANPTLKYLPFWYIKRTSVKGLLLTMLYGLIVVPATFLLARGLNDLLRLIGWMTPAELITGDGDGLEPISFGFIFLIVDFIYFHIKWQVVKYYNQRTKRIAKQIVKEQLQIRGFQDMLTNKSISADRANDLQNQIIRLQSRLEQKTENPFNVNKKLQPIDDMINELERQISAAQLAFDDADAEKKHLASNQITDLKIKQRNMKEDLRTKQKEIEDLKNEIREFVLEYSQTTKNDSN